MLMTLSTLFVMILSALEDPLLFMPQSGRIRQQYMQSNNGHQNIIRLHGVTNLDLDKKEYSLILECADGGTLKDHLRKNTIDWKNQLRFAKEIASAVLWLHDDKGIVHGDLHHKNILIHKDTIKLADFGRSFEKGKDCNNTGVYGIIPYVDPKAFDQGTSYKINEKSDIYSLGILFWELTSRSSPFKYETKDHTLMFDILKGLREKPIQNTNAAFVELYQTECWEHEPDKRPDIRQVNLELNSIDSKNNNVSTTVYSEEIETSEKIGSEDSDLSNYEEDCDLDEFDLDKVAACLEE
ncbi:kinase-like protein [Rhizophagus irregularis]|uniref:Kinase-like protein n=1 Tax=Rhizophagus irregularis TaxID=588596 RepID=A0A2I1GCG2_9GLOM|nr:kinase-like protein [Rhizophagus irregularis]